jgi:hypothetical protein
MAAAPEALGAITGAGTSDGLSGLTEPGDGSCVLVGKEAVSCADCAGDFLMSRRTFLSCFRCATGRSLPVDAFDDSEAIAEDADVPGVFTNE